MALKYLGNKEFFFQEQVNNSVLQSFLREFFPEAAEEQPHCLQTRLYERRIIRKKVRIGSLLNEK